MGTCFENYLWPTIIATTSILKNHNKKNLLQLISVQPGMQHTTTNNNNNYYVWERDSTGRKKEEILCFTILTIPSEALLCISFHLKT